MTLAGGSSSNDARASLSCPGLTWASTYQPVDNVRFVALTWIAGSGPAMTMTAGLFCRTRSASFCPDPAWGSEAPCSAEGRFDEGVAQEGNEGVDLDAIAGAKG